ncbi:FkbO/Hyg5 family chorismatase [Streptomyces sp. 8N616]|uniref:FkbO/Hyg5 family chorismatase n=1 Tax=Streptomyces sp. 8N616 TaxID=3457414 RepID=UPI003FD426E8
MPKLLHPARANAVANTLTSKFTAIKNVGDVPDARPGSRVLGLVNYSDTGTDPQSRNGHVELSIHMADSADKGFSEAWYTGRPTECGVRDGISYAHDGEYLFCAGRIPPATAYTEATRAAYSTIFDLIASLGYRNIFRMWNFVADINGDNAEHLEIYRDFCRGRTEAFERHGMPTDQMPAATGIGSLGGGIAFYLLASRSGHRVNIENPRQMAAYHYPKLYGPKSPAFARATYIAPEGPPDTNGQLFVAGTASILGHRTIHQGDVEKQCSLALDNISSVIGTGNLLRYGIQKGYELTDLRNVKVYIRRREDMPVVRNICEQAFSPTTDIAYLNVDICRSELLVEIEGIAA